MWTDAVVAYLTENWLIAVSTPIYIVLIALEAFFSNYYHKKYYTWRETLINLWLNIANASLGMLVKALVLIFLGWIAQFHILYLPQQGWLYWLVLFFCVDLSFYIEHCAEHYVRILWAVHVTHHSSKEFNLTTGFRSSVFRPFVSFWFYIPWVILLGCHPLDLLLVDAICQIYGIMVHTQFVKKMPRWFEYIFVTPSHHRVHHASNIAYLDKNMGMSLIIWDRIFGTFQAELPGEKIVYGLTKNPEHPFHPIYIITHEWQAIGRILRNSDISWRNKLKYLINPPGWSHDGSSLTSVQLRNQQSTNHSYTE